MEIRYNHLIIEIINEQSSNIALLAKKYVRQYPEDLGHKFEFKPSSKHGVRVNENGVETVSALLLGTGGATDILANSFLIKNNQIYICCSDHVYCLNLPDLAVNWRFQFDIATCFGIYEFDDDFIIHGEFQISRIDKYGQIKWTFGGRDIFVNPDGKDEIKIVGNRIKLTDFQGNNYELTSEGIEIPYN